MPNFNPDRPRPFGEVRQEHDLTRLSAEFKKTSCFAEKLKNRAVMDPKLQKLCRDIVKRLVWKYPKGITKEQKDYLTEGFYAAKTGFLKNIIATDPETTWRSGYALPEKLRDEWAKGKQIFVFENS